VADFDGDGLPDLALVGTDDSTSVWLGRGDGTFRPGPLPAGGVGIPALIAAGDMNGDGAADLVLYDSVPYPTDDHVYLLRGAGDGTFGAPVELGAGRSIALLSLDDVDGDGHLDVVRIEEGRVTVWPGRGDGTVATAAGAVSSGAPMRPLAMVAADLDGDGRLDLAITGDDDSVVAMRGAGDGTFSVAQSVPTATGPAALAAGDLDGDGRLDLVVGTAGEATLTVLRGLGGGVFAAPVAVPVDQTAQALALADFDGDGPQDTALAGPPAAPPGGPPDALVTVRPGGGDGTFGAPITYQGAHGAATALIAFDADGDGRLDLLDGGESDFVIFVAQGGPARYCH
jgi:hypothetical protein